MFIGEDGRVVTVRHFKGLVAGTAFLLAVLVAAALTLYYQHGRRLEEIKALTKDVAALETENSEFEREMERMLARQVILESRLKAREQEDATDAVKASTGESAEKPPAPVEAEGSAEKTLEKQASAGETAVQKDQQATARDATQASAPPVAVANRNLVVCREPEAELVRVEYQVVNEGPKDVPVAGRSVIVLKNGDMSSEEWIVLPNVPLQDMKPAGENGKRFRIYNFRTLKYQFAESLLQGKIDLATIFTYDDDGKLLVERDYNLETTAEMCP